MSKVLKKNNKCKTNNLQSGVSNFLPHLNLKKTSLLLIGLINFVGHVEAGIIIPAGDWTLDISGNVNSFIPTNKKEINNAAFKSAAETTLATMGLLPAASGKTRQNDLDVSFTISANPGATQSNTSNSTNTQNRQAFLTFGDANWGAIKVGKDIGIFASDAILDDMTLLGVGAGAGPTNSTLGRIGTGYIYADWKPQAAYTTPNFNGFQATAVITEPWSGTDPSSPSYSSRGSASPAYEGKASYSFAANDVTGKVWVSGISQKSANDANDVTGRGWDIGAKVAYQGVELVGYYYGEGLSQTGTNRRDSDGGYVQATWGVSNLDNVQADNRKNESRMIGAYYPLMTKYLNPVAEYSNINAQQIHTQGAICSIK